MRKSINQTKVPDIGNVQVEEIHQRSSLYNPHSYNRTYKHVEEVKGKDPIMTTYAHRSEFNQTVTPHSWDKSTSGYSEESGNMNMVNASVEVVSCPRLQSTNVDVERTHLTDDGDTTSSDGSGIDYASKANSNNIMSSNHGSYHQQSEQQPVAPPRTMKETKSSRIFNGNRSRSMNRDYDRRSSNDEGLRNRSNSRYRVTDLDRAFTESKENIDYRNEFSQQHLSHQNGSKDNETNRGNFNKSYTSLIETDIDTGNMLADTDAKFVYETDVDTMARQQTFTPFYPDKTRSMSNLNYAHPNQTVSYPVNNVNPAQPSANDDWLRAQSVQMLSDTPAKKQVKDSIASSNTASGLIARLRARAKSDHELRVAQSLSKLNIPDWLNQADMPEPYVYSNELMKQRESKKDIDQRHLTPAAAAASAATDEVSTKPFSMYARSASSRNFTSPSFSHEANNLRNSLKIESTLNRGLTAVEMVAEPNNAVATSSGSTIPRFVRPSTLYKLKSGNSKRLQPIQSRLNHSMKSLSMGSDGNPFDQQSRRPSTTIAPASSSDRQDKVNESLGMSTPIKLMASDFVPKKDVIEERSKYVTPPRSNKIEKESVAPQAKPRIHSIGYSLPKEEKLPQPNHYFHNDGVKKDAKDSVNVEVMTQRQLAPTIDNSKFPFPPREKPDGHSHPNTLEFNKNSDNVPAADEESSYLIGKVNTEVKPLAQTDPFTARLNAVPKQIAPFVNQNGSCSVPVAANNNHDSLYAVPAARKPVVKSNVYFPKLEYHLQDNYINQTYQRSTPFDDNHTSMPSSPQPIDLDGEIEDDTVLSNATDGFDQISTLTSLTDLIDSSIHRYLVLFGQNSAAVHSFLTSVGWLNFDRQPITPSVEQITTSMRKVDFDDDNHKVEFLQLLASPESRKPINLSEFALSHLSGCIERNRHDGLIYLSCALSGCTTGPTRSHLAKHWRTCANCFTIYCSTQCRKLDHEAGIHHAQCNFSRAKRACSKLLKTVTLNQCLSFSSLAKAGYAKLGRGAVVLVFSSIQNAETYLRRNERLMLSGFNEDERKQTLNPKSTGLLVPPLYLTLNELNELDSTVALPCKNYAPNKCFVLISTVCAFELRSTMENGLLPVHLIKQSMIIKFPHFKTSTQRPSNGASNGVFANTTKEERTIFSHKLQKLLRSHGISLRNHFPQAYKTLADFVDNGDLFDAIKFTAPQYTSQNNLKVIIRPMMDPQFEEIPIESQPQNNGVHENGHRHMTETEL